MPSDLPSSMTRPKHQTENNNNIWHFYLWRRLTTGSRWREHIITVSLGDIKTERHIPGSRHSLADYRVWNEKLKPILFVRFSPFVLSERFRWMQFIWGWVKHRGVERGRKVQAETAERKTQTHSKTCSCNTLRLTVQKHVAVARPAACSPSFFN